MVDTAHGSAPGQRPCSLLFAVGIPRVAQDPQRLKLMHVGASSGKVLNTVNRTLRTGLGRAVQVGPLNWNLTVRACVAEQGPAPPSPQLMHTHSHTPDTLTHTHACTHTHTRDTDTHSPMHTHQTYIHSHAHTHTHTCAHTRHTLTQ